MVFSFLEKLGEKTLNASQSMIKALGFTLRIFIHIFRPSSYHPAMRTVLIKQIYFTSVQILPLFTFLAIFFGSIMVGMLFILASEYGFTAEIGHILTTFIFNEFAPLFTAFLIALRSGTAVSTELALMSVNHELNTLKTYRINLINYLFLPRILAGMISLTTLSFIFTVIMLISGYLIALFYLQMELSAYLRLILNAMDFGNILMLVIKSLTFGFFIMMIPIYSGLNVVKSYHAIPIAVLNGMVLLFTTIFIIEAAALYIWFM